MESVRTRYMGHGESHLIHGMQNSILGCIILIGMCFFGVMTIACALSWGVASVRVYSIGHCSPHCGTPFQVQGVCRETTLTQGCLCEESRVMALILTFVKYIRINCFDICFLCKKHCN